VTNDGFGRWPFGLVAVILGGLSLGVIIVGLELKLGVY
jgi:hypothetical protein